MTLTSLIPAPEMEAVRAHLERHLAGNVGIDLYAGPRTGMPAYGCLTCEETRALLEEVVTLSRLITLRVHDVAGSHPTEVARIPTIALKGAARGKVRYVGIPSGYEFAGLLADLVDVSTGHTSLAAETKRALAALGADVRIQVFVTPTCPFCPRVARLAHQMAVESAHVVADVVDASEFPDLVERYEIHGVPKVVINETVHLLGAQTEAQLLAAVRQAVSR